MRCSWARPNLDCRAGRGHIWTQKDEFRESRRQKDRPEEALKLLEQAWAYYTPMPKPVPQAAQADQPELFQYANAA